MRPYRPSNNLAQRAIQRTQQPQAQWLRNGYGYHAAQRALQRRIQAAATATCPCAACERIRREGDLFGLRRPRR
jgi:hypothetical protein